MFETLAPLSDPALRWAMLIVSAGFMLLEYALSRLADHDVHDLGETAASLGVALGQHLFRLVEAGLVAVPFMLAWQYRLFDFDSRSPLALGILFLATEFLYYWHHRASHRIRWLWATHAVHHSATRLNLTAAIRLGWTGNITGHFLFYVPLAWLGFHPFAILAMLGLNLAYQFFIHTELAPGLGPLEWVLNTPQHHRVHHASNDACLDRNYGGVLIVFDRLFGSFAEAPTGEALRYGLVGGAPTNNPFRIAFGTWGKILRDVWTARTLRARFDALTAPPGVEIDPYAGRTDRLTVTPPKPENQEPSACP